MNQVKGCVAILEDESSLCEAMKQAFERLGFEVYTSSNTRDILDFLNSKNVGTLFVDCLLPQDSGVDFATEVRVRYPASVLDIVLMSGVFTDNLFIKESVRSTQAVAFLKKPFEMKTAIQYLKANLAIEPIVEKHPLKALYSLMNQPHLPNREKIKTIEALEEVNGFDLPFIYALLSRAQVSGHLNIVNSAGAVSGVSFAQGRIVGVDIADQDTFLGKLLIEGGYIHPDDLEVGLSIRSNKKLGEKLIQNHLVSPHAFQLALTKQMSLRLSRTIQDGVFRLNFVKDDGIVLAPPYISSEQLTDYLHDWAASKITFEWLKQHYIQWQNRSFLVHPLDSSGLSFEFPLVKGLESAFSSGLEGMTLGQFLEAHQKYEERHLRAIHFLILRGEISFGSSMQKQNQTPSKFLESVFVQIQGKKVFESWMAIARIAGLTDSEPEKVYQEFLKVLGPAPEANLADAVKLYKEIRKIVESVYQVVRNDKVGVHKEETVRADLEKKMRAASHFEEAKNLLQKSAYAPAKALLDKVFSVDPQAQKLFIYLAWAKVGLLDPQSVKPQQVLEIEMDLMQVPPEDKVDALYFFVTGLCQKLKGDIAGAKRSIDKAIHLDSGLIVARREQSVLVSLLSQKTNVLDRDLKDLVAGFFKKRSSS